MTGQPIFQLIQNQYRERKLEGWKDCYYYELEPAVPLVYIPDGNCELIWDVEQKSLYSLRGIKDPGNGDRKMEQVISLPLEGRLLLGFHISAGYQCSYNIKELEHWLQRLETYPDFVERAACCNHELDRVLQRNSMDPLVFYAVQQMTAAKGRIVVENLSFEYDYTPRQLERLFHKIYGCTPKRMSQYIRLLSAVNMMKYSPEESFASISEQLGYSDPAHFQREFKRFMGKTPGQFKKCYMETLYR